LVFGVAALVNLVALVALAEAGEAAFFFGGVCAFALAGDVFSFAGEAFALAGEAFAFAGDAFTFAGEVIFVNLPVCTFSAAAAAS